MNIKTLCLLLLVPMICLGLLACSETTDETGTLLTGATDAAVAPGGGQMAPTGGGGIGFGAGGGTTGTESAESGDESTEGETSNADCPEGEELTSCTCPDGTTGSGCSDSFGVLTGSCICVEQLDDIPCAGDDDCTAEQPYCKTTLSKCVECLESDQCDTGEFCNNGICKTLLCGPGENACNGNKLQVCNEDGTSFDLFDCEPGVCEDGKCLGCELGTKTCLNGNVIECVEGESGEPEYVEIETCESEQLCSDGKCLVCFPGTKKCDGKDVFACNNDGSALEYAETCSSNQTCVGGYCQSLCAGDIKFNTNVGCDYWAVDLDNVEGDPLEGVDGANNAQFAIVVSNTSDKPAEITVRSSDEGEPTAQETVAPGALKIFNLAPYNVDGSVKTTRAWRLEASAPIVAYQFNPLENELVYSNDASVLFPSNSWGEEYYILTQGQLQTFARGFLTVVAGFAGTEVTVTPTTKTAAGPGVPAMNAGESQTFTLEPYEILNIETDTPDGDLTGTKVTANQPIGVFGGHECGVSNTDTCCCDHLEQMMIPVSAWGKAYVAAKSAQRGIEGDYWKIVASEDGTQVNTNPYQGDIPVLNAGQSFELKSNTSFLIQSDKPVMVGQFLASSYEINGSCEEGCQSNTSCQELQPGLNVCSTNILTCSVDSDCPSGNTCVSIADDLFGGTAKQCEPIGDPAFMLAAPVEQFRDSYVFLVPNEYLQNFLTITAPVGTELLLDGQPVVLDPIPGACTQDNTCWATKTVSLGDGTHSINSTNKESFGIMVHGYDDDVSYGYPGGLDLETLND